MLCWYWKLRGEGFVFALATRDGRSPTEIRDAMLQRGVTVRALADAIAFCPPLVTTEPQVERIVEAAEEVA